jgi:hypothetical protein
MTPAEKSALVMEKHLFQLQRAICKTADRPIYLFKVLQNEDSFH